MANVLRNALVLLNFDPRSQQLAPSCGSAATAGEVVDLLLSPQTSTSVSSKLFESVSWFLFSKSDPDRAKQLFHGCWPIVDKQQAREFRSSVLKELERLKREGLLPSFVQIRRSYFEECRGERFEIALLAMSVYTLQMVLAREFGADQNTLRLPTPQEDLEGSMKAFDPEHQEAIFFSSQRDRDGVEVKWIEFARQLQQELLTTEQNDSKTGPSIESSVLKELQTVCQDKLASVEALWCQLEDIDKGLGSSFDIIEAALSNGASPAALEGPIEPIELPSFISKEVSSHLYDSMGKLDLQALVNLSTEVLNRTKTELDRLGQTEFLNEGLLLADGSGL
ncbi:HAUS augmin-like complex subunit 6 N-terminus-domain-containing protein [Zopfochytrium polystomum]|nr:HAUS augmin-like complex subunit 6 N-terminus-domain-containing protein [Zopfochytrium polystomum]